MIIQITANRWPGILTVAMPKTPMMVASKKTYKNQQNDKGIEKIEERRYNTWLKGEGTK